MPAVKDIDKFNETLVTLGNEPEVLSRWGESLEHVETPAEGLDNDLNDLLNDVETEEDRGTNLPPDDGADFEALMESLNVDNRANDEDQEGGDEPENLFEDSEPGEPFDESEEPDESIPESAEPPEDEEFSLDDFNLDDDFFSEGEETEDLPDFKEEEPAPPEEEEPAPPEEEDRELFEETEEGGPEADEFAEADFAGELPDFGEEEQETPAEEEPEVFEEPGESVPETADDESFGDDMDFGDFSLDDQEFGEIEEAEAAGDDDFALPDIGETEEEAEEETDELPEGIEETAEPDVPDEFSLETPEGSEELFLDEEETGGEGEFSADSFNIDTEPGDETFSLDDDVPGGEGEEDFEIDEFSLGDFGAEFGIDDDTSAEVEPEDHDNPANELPESPAEEFAEAGLDEYSISSESFSRIKKTLGALPLNLKIAVEEQIAGGGGSPDQVKLLLRQLAEGAPIGEIAAATGKIAGKKIKLPEGYEKRSGYIFEEERNSFSYRFAHNVIPILKVVLITLASAGVVGFLAYRFIYRPIHARNLYAAGYENLTEENYSRAENYFDRAVSVLPRQGWFFRYAEGYTEKDEYILAEEKYEEILARYPSERKGYLDFAEFESETLANYERAESILNRWLEDELYDYDALLLAGDNYMEWGKEDPSRYENARQSYVTLLRRYGERDELLFRMLSYFIAVDNYDEVVRLKTLFQSDPGVDVEPLIYARLGGYLLAKGDIQEVRDILVRALRQDERLPEIHYNLAKYYRVMKDPLEEEKALKNTRSLLLAVNPLPADRTRILVDTYGRLGEVYFDRREYQKSQENLSEAVSRYERALEADLFGRDPRFGSFYTLLGDIRYYAFGEFDAAFDLYNVAESHGYIDPEMNYKRGVIHYKNNRYREGLTEFSIAEEELWNNRNILYAFGNTMYRLGNYYPAQGYYEALLDDLQTQKRRTENLFPEEDERHDALLINIYKVQNNLGITMIKLGDQFSNPSYRAEGLAVLTESSENYDNYARDRDTMVRSRTKNLAYLNQRNAILPQSDFDLEIYGDLPLDSEELYF
jgi:tetratricopeptide (TPR) repeat protein